jgi:endonuclease YncB( thermonuclease family)
VKLFLAGFFFFFTFATAHAANISGVPVITDGDTVIIGGETIRLLDMDAPETDQFCLDQKREAWDCGIDARNALIRRAGGKQWTCEMERRDAYGRWLASCMVENENISSWMVRHGWAMSPIHEGYSHRFDSDEATAKASRAGLWAGGFIAPWDWRRRNCKTQMRGAISVPIDAQKKLCGSPSEPPDPSCTIKANTRSGKCVYHIEGGRYYGPIKMTGSGKRWFCSEAEAQAAGCRRSSR